MLHHAPARFYVGTSACVHIFSFIHVVHVLEILRYGEGIRVNAICVKERPIYTCMCMRPGWYTGREGRGRPREISIDTDRGKSSTSVEALGDGGCWKMVQGAKWRETGKECTSARSIFKERGRERARLCAVVEPWKIIELGGQASLILYGEGQFINLNHFTSNWSTDHIHISLNI
jgi:hypothetical protein